MTEGLTIFGKTVFDTLFINWKIMVPVAIFSIIVFFVGLYLQLDKWGRAVPEDATKPVGAWGTLKLIVHKIFEKGVGSALGIIILDGLFQRRTWRRRKTEWLMHILIFWGWVGLFILTVAAAAAEFYGPFVKGTDYVFFANFWKSIERPNDIFAYMLVLGIAIAIIRRVFFAGVPPEFAVELSDCGASAGLIVGPRRREESAEQFVQSAVLRDEARGESAHAHRDAAAAGRAAGTTAASGRTSGSPTVKPKIAPTVFAIARGEVGVS